MKIFGFYCGWWAIPGTLSAVAVLVTDSSLWKVVLLVVCMACCSLDGKAEQRYDDRRQAIANLGMRYDQIIDGASTAVAPIPLRCVCPVHGDVDGQPVEYDDSARPYMSLEPLAITLANGTVAVISNGWAVTRCCPRGVINRTTTVSAAATCDFGDVDDPR